MDTRRTRQSNRLKRTALSNSDPEDIFSPQETTALSGRHKRLKIATLPRTPQFCSCARCLLLNSKKPGCEQDDSVIDPQQSPGYEEDKPKKVWERRHVRGPTLGPAHIPNDTGVSIDPSSQQLPQPSARQTQVTRRYQTRNWTDPIRRKKQEMRRRLEEHGIVGWTPRLQSSGPPFEDDVFGPGGGTGTTIIIRRRRRNARRDKRKDKDKGGKGSERYEDD